MKRKGITIWELYLERIVLGAAGLFFVAFGGFQLLRSPNTVSIQNRQVAPAEINDLLRDKASEVGEQLTPGAPAAIQVPDHSPLLPDFQSRVSGSIGPAAVIAIAQRPVRISDQAITIADVQYYEPKFDAPRPIEAKQFFDAIHPEVISSTEAIESLVGPAPYDVTWVVPAAVVDLDGMREELKRSTPAMAAIPMNWHEGRVDIFDLVVERETLVDGSWSDRRTIDVPPGFLSFRERLASSIDRPAWEKMIGELRHEGSQEAVIRPPFYDSIGSSFSGRSEALPTIEETDGNRQLAARRKALAEKLAEQKSLREELARLGGREDRKPKEPERSGGSTGGGAGGGDGNAPGEGSGGGDGGVAPPGAGGSPGLGGGGDGGGRRELKGPPRKAAGAGAGAGLGAGGSGDETGSGDQDLDRQERRREARIDRIKRDLKRLSREIERLADQIEAETGIDPLEATTDEGPEKGASANLMDGPSVVVWAHDLSALPEMTYRYRFTLQVRNPFYTRKLDLIEAQHSLADRPVLASKTSAWSEEIRTAPMSRLYVTSAQWEQGRLGFGSAQAEVFRFNGGRWWRAQFSVEPGGRVGGLEKVGKGPDAPEVDFGTDWFVLDIIRDIEAERDAATRGLDSIVLIQRLVGGETLTLHPVLVEDDLDRAWLMQQVDEADARTTELASGAP